MSSINPTSSCGTSQRLIILHSPSCPTLSNACLKSIKLLYSVLFISVYFSESCLITNICSIVPLPFQNSACSSLIYSSTYLFICCCNTLVYTFRSEYFSESCLITNICSIVPLPFQNSACSSLIYSSTYLFICCCNTLVYTF